MQAASSPAVASADLIRHPSHYIGHGGLECISIIHAWGLGYDLGTALAYILRHQRKGEPLRDLRKARQHLAMAEGLPLERLLISARMATEFPAEAPTYTEFDIAAAFDLPDLLRAAVASIGRGAVDLAAAYVGMHIADLEAVAQRSATSV